MGSGRVYRSAFYGYWAKAKVIAPVFPTHTANLFQVLDFVIFGVMTNSRDSLANKLEVASTHKQIWKPIRVYDQTATPFMIRSCFHKAGL
jgi:hypothetical protein